MKAYTLIIITALISYSLTAQEFDVSQVELKGLDCSNISSTEFINPATKALVVLWGHVKTSDQDQLEKIQSAWQKSLKSEDVKLIVVCAGNIASKSQLKELASERNWEFEMYFDYHGEFVDALNVPKIPAILFFGENQSLICHSHVNCTGKINIICNNILENLGSLAQNTVRIYDSTKNQCPSPPSHNSRLW